MGDYFLLGDIGSDGLETPLPPVRAIHPSDDVPEGLRIRLTDHAGASSSSSPFDPSITAPLLPVEAVFEVAVARLPSPAWPQSLPLHPCGTAPTVLRTHHEALSFSPRR
jgi:hypothetical protein